jgi:MarR family transcriptional regulator, 2-MHQ and catechol-resistance regulon repressor
MGTHYRGGTRERRALDTYIKLLRAADSMASELARHTADAGLTAGQFGVMEALLHLGPLSQADLGLKLLRSGSNVTTIIDNLERRKLVRRARRTDDRRVIDVSLTASGSALIRRLFPAHARRIAALLDALPVADQIALGDLCRTLGRSVARARRAAKESPS